MQTPFAFHGRAIVFLTFRQDDLARFLIDGFSRQIARALVIPLRVVAMDKLLDAPLQFTRQIIVLLQDLVLQ